LGERHFDLSQQPLSVRFRNALGGELRRLDTPVEKRHRQKVRQAVVGLFFRVNIRLRTE
jgi:hypothetical protein